MAKPYQVDTKSYRGCIAGVADGWFTAGDAEAYKELVSPIKNGIIIEIGSYQGLSLYHIKDICKNNNTELISVDFIAYERLVKNTKEWDIPFICKKSVDAARLFPDYYFDLVFIDADHHKNFVIEDVLAWTPKVKKKGILSGHDFLQRTVQRGIQHCLDKSKVSHKATIWWCQSPYSLLKQPMPKKSKKKLVNFI